MLVLKILDVKRCMNDILATELFDKFQLAEASIITKVSYVIDGHVTPDFFSEEEAEQEGIDAQGCMPYGFLRPLCFDMIKGKRTPRSFRFTFLLPRAEIIRLLETEPALPIRETDVANLTMNVKYAEETLQVTTSCSMHTFLLDKSLELLWDRWVLDFYKKLEIPVEKIV
jgi:hypothetical protein